MEIRGQGTNNRDAAGSRGGVIRKEREVGGEIIRARWEYEAG
jgi:hypothetical protein